MLVSFEVNYSPGILLKISHISKIKLDDKSEYSDFSQLAA